MRDNGNGLVKVSITRCCALDTLDTTTAGTGAVSITTDFTATWYRPYGTINAISNTGARVHLTITSADDNIDVTEQFDAGWSGHADG